MNILLVFDGAPYSDMATGMVQRFALGSRGLSGIGSLLLGSVAERVARYADCSVLIGREAK